MSLTREQLTTYLTEAQTALHALMTGEREVRVRVRTEYSDREVVYQEADTRKLEIYIRNLEQQIAALDNGGFRRRSVRLYC